MPSAKPRLVSPDLAKPPEAPAQKRAIPAKPTGIKTAGKKTRDVLFDDLAPASVAALVPASIDIPLVPPLINNSHAESLKLTDLLPEVEQPSIPEPALVEALAPFNPAASTLSATPINNMVKFMDQTTSALPFKGYGDIAAFNKANLDAVIQANQILAKGFEEFSKEFISISQSSVESATSAAKAMFAARSLKDMMEVNAEHTKSMFDKFMSNSTKLSEMSVKVATDALSPVTARVQSAVEKAIKPSPIA